MTNEEKEEPRWEGQYRGICCKKAVFFGGGRGLLTYTWIINQKYQTMLLLSYDDMIYTDANM